ncbi:MAG: hypothetical protein WCL02_06220 [bacterium]
MVIRNLKQKKILNGKLVVWLVGIALGIYLLSKVFVSVVERFNQTTPPDALYTLGASLTFSGKIVVDNNFPNYTHSLINIE